MNLGPIKGSFIAGFFVVIAFVATAFGFKHQSDQLTNLQTQVAKPAPTTIVVVTPTDAPTATPSASLKSRISTPASVTKSEVTKPVIVK